MSKTNFYIFILFPFFLLVSCKRPDIKVGSGQLVYQSGMRSDRINSQVHTNPYIQKINIPKNNYSIAKIRQFYDDRMLILSNGNLYLYDGLIYSKLDVIFKIANFEVNTSLDTIFVLGESQGGYLSKSRFGTIVYHSLFKDNYGRDFRFIQETKDSVFFISQTKILSVKKQEDSLNLAYSMPLGYEIKSSFILSDSLFFNVYAKDLVKYDKGKLVEVDYWQETDTDKFRSVEKRKFPQTVSTTILSDSLILLSDLQKLYVYSTGKYLFSYDLKDSIYKQVLGISVLAHLDSNLILLGTLNSGLFLVNFSERSILQHFTIKNGLPSNEIKSLFVDEEKNIWIGQDGGLSKINFALPVKDYSYSGLSGIVSALSSDDSLVGTSQGFYRLSHTNDSVIIYQKINSYDFKVLGIEKEKEGKYWIISNSDIFLYENDKLGRRSHLPLINSYVYSPPKHKIYLGTSQGIFIYDTETTILNEPNSLIKDVYYSIQADKRGNIWLGSDNHILLITLTDDGYPLAYYKYKLPNTQKSPIHIIQLDSRIVFVQTDECYSINLQKNIIERDSIINFGKIDFSYFGKNLWTKSKRGIWQNENQRKDSLSKYLNLFNSVSFLKDDSLSIWLGTEGGGFYKIKKETKYAKRQECFVWKIESLDSALIPLDEINLTAFENSLEIFLTAPNYYGSDGVRFRYEIKGVTKKWSKWQASNIIKIDYLPYGVHNIFYQSRNQIDEYSFPKIIDVTVIKPLWLRIWFIISVLLILIVLTAYIVFIMMKVREQQVVAEKKVLERKVEERTDELQTKQTEILDSITYASRIQSAMLPDINGLKDDNIDFFILNRPKNIVSGDFYWFLTRNKELYITVGDCTGHGVPGAFMSVLGVTLLNQIIRQKEQILPHQILEELKALIIENLNQSDKHNELQDGIDMAFVKIDFSKLTLYFSGAYNPLYIVRSGELIEFKGQRMPIGIFIRKDIFKTFNFDLQRGDIIYLFSDGYVDQTGGEKGHKFTKKRFKAILSEIAEKPIVQQKIILETELDSWKKGYPQVDDIMILGLKIK